MQCRSCYSNNLSEILDLKSQPLSNAFLTKEQLNKPEVTYPLVAYLCLDCMLMQVGAHETRENIFNEEYVYFSGQSQDWLKHCEDYANKMIERFEPEYVMEIASNDGSLLKYFDRKGVQVLGVEPSRSVAETAIHNGINTIVEFFGESFAKNLPRKYDIITANNVLAHVPDLNDFIAGIKAALAPRGVVTVEFPYVANLLRDLQFDTIYQEHFSYFSLMSVRKAFTNHELEIFDVDELPTHGGSLRIYASHPGVYAQTSGYRKVDASEIMDAYHSPVSVKQYMAFGEEVRKYKRDFLNILIKLKSAGETIVAYGAPAKGNTLLNYCGIGTDFIDYCVDSTPFKQSKYLPGSHIPVYHPDMIKVTKPTTIYVQPWNWKDEIIAKLEFIKEWDAKILVKKEFFQP